MTAEMPGGSAAERGRNTLYAHSISAGYDPYIPNGFTNTVYQLGKVVIYRYRSLCKRCGTGVSSVHLGLATNNCVLKEVHPQTVLQGQTGRAFPFWGDWNLFFLSISGHWFGQVRFWPRRIRAEFRTRLLRRRYRLTTWFVGDTVDR